MGTAEDHLLMDKSPNSSSKAKPGRMPLILPRETKVFCIETPAVKCENSMSSLYLFAVSDTLYEVIVM